MRMLCGLAGWPAGGMGMQILLPLFLVLRFFQIFIFSIDGSAGMYQI